ncbi:MAG TPA: hypothetical protein DIT99_31900 [Candidatus Latescibacteria bacterium]|nr:hypothetical protein [Candidatus Latescibacterota bacterium]
MAQYGMFSCDMDSVPANVRNFKGFILKAEPAAHPRHQVQPECITFFCTGQDNLAAKTDTQDGCSLVERCFQC